MAVLLRDYLLSIVLYIKAFVLWKYGKQFYVTENMQIRCYYEIMHTY